MRYIIVTNGTEYGALEQGRPLPYNFHQVGDPRGYASKEEAQEWVWEEIEAWEALDLRMKILEGAQS